MSVKLYRVTNHVRKQGNGKLDVLPKNYFNLQQVNLSLPKCDIFKNTHR
jgi:hypothetical protein